MTRNAAVQPRTNADGHGFAVLREPLPARTQVAEALVDATPQAVRRPAGPDREPSPARNASESKGGVELVWTSLCESPRCVAGTARGPAPACAHALARKQASLSSPSVPQCGIRVHLW